MSKDKDIKKKEDENELPGAWKQVQGAIWLIGLAILAWQDWWWPGILVLVAISGLTQAFLKMYLTKKEQAVQAVEEQNQEQKQQQEQQQQVDQQRAAWLPSTCPQCGGPISVSTVNWTGPDSGDCPYCKAHLRPPA
jgi:hypothetical protein